MRNLTDEQATELAFGLVRDHLGDGIEFGIIVGDLADFQDDPEDPVEEEDAVAVESQINQILELLTEALENIVKR